VQYAAEAGHAPTVELLVKAGAELDRQTAQGSTALLMAATTTAGLSPMHIRVAHPDFPAVVRGLVDAGADVNLPGVCCVFCCLWSPRTLCCVLLLLLPHTGNSHALNEKPSPAQLGLLFTQPLKEPLASPRARE